MNNDNERWLTDGDCTKCRRQKYCSKPCTKHKHRIRNLVYSALNEKTGGTLDTIHQKLEENKEEK